MYSGSIHYAIKVLAYIMLSRCWHEYTRSWHVSSCLLLQSLGKPRWLLDSHALLFLVSYRWQACTQDLEWGGSNVWASGESPKFLALTTPTLPIFGCSPLGSAHHKSLQINRLSPTTRLTNSLKSFKIIIKSSKQGSPPLLPPLLPALPRS